MAEPVALTRKDFSSDQEVRWCPGLRGLLGAHRAAAPHARARGQAREPGVRERHRLLEPIPVLHEHLRRAQHPRPRAGGGDRASRWPVPDLDVWVVTGDGDGLSIGGNHLIHALRRNVNFTILLFNNQIYGLTKGQYSPTSELGKVTKSSPFGSLDHPFNPIWRSRSARRRRSSPGPTTWTASTCSEVFRRAHEHKGAAFVEIYQNCNVFNDGAFSAILTKDNRPEMLIELVHGEPIRFGADKDKGVRLNKYGEAEIVEHRRRGRGRGARPRRAPHRPDRRVRAVTPRRPPDRADPGRRVPRGPAAELRVRGAAPARGGPGAAGPGRPADASSAARASGKSPSRH